MEMKVLLNDGFAKEGADILKNAGFEINKPKPEERLKGQQLLDEIGKYDCIVVRSATPVTREVVEAGANGLLKIVGRAGVGVDGIDVDTATQYGIVVKYAPSGNTDSVAELSLGMMIALSRNITKADATLKSGKWIKGKFKGQELAHKTLGIMGCGRIGMRLATIARGIGMEVIAYDIHHNPDADVVYVDKENLLKNSDYISINAKTLGVVIGKEELALMKPTAYLINAARGKNLDETALYNALKEGKIAGAGLDVFIEEPKVENADFTNKLRALDNVVLTSHLGASTKEAERRTSVEMAEVVRDYLLKGDFKNAVNVEGDVASEGAQLYSLFIHHKDIPGAFATFDKIFADNGVNIRENNSRQMSPGKVSTVYLLHQKPDDKVINSLRKSDIVYRVVI
jgi:D-3-phosphoglycerate dehydrogenase